MSSKSQIKIGCEVLIWQNGALLLGKRKNAYGAGSWGLPGGHLEYGEKLIDAAHRELNEELGVIDTQLSFTAVIDDIRDDQHYIHLVFTTENFQGKIRHMEPDKCEEWRYFSLDNLPENIFVAHQRILETVRQKTFYLP